MTPHKFYNVTGEGAGGGEVSPEFKDAMVAQKIAYKEQCKVDRDGGHLADCDFEEGALWAYRHLSPSPFPPIPRDIISFWDEVLKKPIPCPDESQYFEWCYWMLRNEHPVHQIQLENEVDKIVYTIGHIVKEPYQDTMVEHTVKSLHWRGNYWSYRNEKGDGTFIDGPIKGDIYHRDRFRRKATHAEDIKKGFTNNTKGE